MNGIMRFFFFFKLIFANNCQSNNFSIRYGPSKRKKSGLATRDYTISVLMDQQFSCINYLTIGCVSALYTVFPTFLYHFHVVFVRIVA